MMKHWLRYICVLMLYTFGGVVEGQTTKPSSKPLPRLWFFTDSGKTTFGEYVEKLKPIDTPREPMLWLEPPRVDFSIIPPLTPTFTEKVNRWWLVPLILGAATTALFFSGNDTPIPPTVPPDIPITPVPEPATGWLLLVGVSLLTIWMYRRRLNTSNTERK